MSGEAGLACKEVLACNALRAGVKGASVVVGQVAGFIRERELKVSEEEEGARSPDMVAALWGLLRLMALNEGRLRSPASPASKAKPSPPLGDSPSQFVFYSPRLATAWLARL